MNTETFSSVNGSESPDYQPNNPPRGRKCLDYVSDDGEKIVDVLNDSNTPAKVDFDASHLLVSLVDGRIIAAPLDWYPWLRDSTADERNQYQVGSYSIIWPELGDGVDMEVMLLGLPEASYLSVQEMAARQGIDENTLQRILRADQALPPNQRRVPGAFKVGSERRGEWRIPREVAETWTRDPRGRKRNKEASGA